MEKLLFEINNLTKKFPKILALDSVDWSVEKNQKWAIIGPNGAGKTTLINIICNSSKPSSGIINRKFSPCSIGLLPQETGLWPNIKVKTWQNFINRTIISEGFKQDYQELSQLLEIESIENKKFQNLSLGQKKRVLLLSSICSRTIPVLDEPLSGLDPKAVFKLKNLFSGNKIPNWIISSHQLGDLEEICSHLLILEEGKVVFKGTKNLFIGASEQIRVKFLRVEDSIIQKIPFKYEKTNDYYLMSIRDLPSNLAMAEIISWAQENNLEILEIAKGSTLENTYAQLNTKTND